MRTASLIICLALVLGLASIGAGSSSARAGQTSTQAKPQPPQNQDDAIRLTSRLVLVPVSASDASGKPVRELTAEDFTIEEEGRLYSDRLAGRARKGANRNRAPL